MEHRICPHCGASLDPGERCDCLDDVDEEQEEKGSGETPAKRPYTDVA